MAGPPRRRPFPVDLVIGADDNGAGGTGFMLDRPPKRGAVVQAQKPPMMDGVVPSDYAYTSQPPSVETVHSYSDLSLGLGLKVQQGSHDRRVKHCICADTSIAGMAMKGPDIDTSTPATADATNGITHFFDIEKSTVLTTFALNGRYVQERAASSDGDHATTGYTVAKDFGSGKAATDVIVVYSNNSGGAKLAYIAMGDSEPMWKFTGSTFTQCVCVQTVTISGSPSAGHYHLLYGGTPTGEIAYNASAATVQTALRAVAGLSSVTVTATGSTPNFTHTVTFYGVTGVASVLTTDVTALTGGSIAVAATQTTAIIYARAFALVGRDLYRAHSTNTVAKVDIDSDPFVAANWSADNAFNVGDKSSGVVKMTSTVAGALAIFKTDGVYSLLPDGEDVQYYPDLKFAPDSNNGKALTAFVNDLYVTYREGTFRIGPDFSRTPIGPERLITNDSEVRGAITAMGGHGDFNLYAGIWNQDIDSAVGASYLMKFGSYVTDETGASVRIDAWNGSISQKFAGKKMTAMGKSTVGAPTGHTRLYIGFSDGTVSWFVLACTPNPAACSQYGFTTTDGEIYYPTWTGGFLNDNKTVRAFTVAGTTLTGSNYAQMEYRTNLTATFTAVGNDFDNQLREQYFLSDEANGDAFDYLLRLKSTATTSTPVVTGVGITWALRRDNNKEVYLFEIACADYLVDRRGMRLKLGADKLRELLSDYCLETGSVNVILPDEENKKMSLEWLGQQTTWNERLRQWKGVVSVRGVELGTNVSAGTYNRIEAMTYTQAEAYSYTGLEAY